jgi:hypothetical protein
MRVTRPYRGSLLAMRWRCHRNGKHDELMAKNGIYAELHRTQFEASASRPPAVMVATG